MKHMLSALILLLLAATVAHATDPTIISQPGAGAVRIVAQGLTTDTAWRATITTDDSTTETALSTVTVVLLDLAPRHYHMAVDSSTDGTTWTAHSVREFDTLEPMALVSNFDASILTYMDAEARTALRINAIRGYRALIEYRRRAALEALAFADAEASLYAGR